MSFSIRNIREISNDPLTKFTNQIAKKLSKFLTEQQTEKLENKEDIYSDGQDVDVALKFNNLGWTNSFNGTLQYFPTFEPDYQYNTCWIKGVNLGSTTRDLSDFGNVATIYGDPILMDGTPFDLGITVNGTRSLCTRFNRPTSNFENEEYMAIPDATNMQVSGIATGISYFIRFRVSSLAQQGGTDRRLFEKTDDSTPNNGVTLRISTSGRLLLHINRGGSSFAWQTATGQISINTVYEVFITYAVSGNVAHIYINNVDKTLTTPSGPSWHSDLSNRDLNIFRRGTGSTGGYIQGDFYDFMVYRERVISSTEVGYHYTNKWTIANIPFGQCMITNYWATYYYYEPSFTSTSFTSTSFDL